MWRLWCVTDRIVLRWRDEQWFSEGQCLLWWSIKTSSDIPLDVSSSLSSLPVCLLPICFMPFCLPLFFSSFSSLLPSIVLIWSGTLNLFWPPLCYLGVQVMFSFTCPSLVDPVSPAVTIVHVCSTVHKTSSMIQSYLVNLNAGNITYDNISQPHLRHTLFWMWQQLLEL